MSKSSNSFSRRKFLGSALTLGAGAFLTNPFRAIAEGIADNIIEHAVAEATATQKSKNYIGLLLPGAPLRYQFDQWLRIHTTDAELLKISTGTENLMTCDSFAFGTNRAVTPTRTPFTYNDFLVPHLFSQQVFTSTGASRPASDLLKNMLVIRGFATGLDGHLFNTLKQLSPIGGVSTLSGLAAENQETTFNSVQWPDRGTSGRYTAQNRAQSRITGSTPLTTLMAGFATPTNAKAYNLKITAEEAMTLAQTRLQIYSRADHKAAEIVAQNLTNATAMLKKGINDITSYWTPAVTRYKTAIETSLQATGLAGISSQEIISDESRLWALGANTGTIVSKDYDARALLNGAYIVNLAESLALAEYLLKQGFAASVEIRGDNLANLDLLKVGTTSIAKYSQVLDMHETGACSSILLMNAYYRGLTAGLLEFIDQLGPALWSNTVLQVLGDFARSARTAGSGSDHGFDQIATSAFSGSFTNGPIVVGNILQKGLNTTTYAGTQGVAAPITGYNQSGKPTTTMAASTIAALLGVSKNPYANTAGPLVALTSGALTALFEPKIVT